MDQTRQTILDTIMVTKTYTFFKNGEKLLRIEIYPTEEHNPTKTKSPDRVILDAVNVFKYLFPHEVEMDGRLNDKIVIDVN